ncbi:MAG: carboxypeptidase regulatory-like domain-containing protein, partial [Magnetococcales bacterium]|nr:carboxypeptidase regulatory-like domain-containing protein [Magnetococcales bacterium]
MRIAKRGWDRGVLVWMLLGLWMSSAPVEAATHDATGRWSLDFVPDGPTLPLAPGCLALPKESFLATLSQDGDVFTVRESAGAEATGSIDIDLYTYHINRSDGSASDVALTLATSDAGSGTVTTNWPDGSGGSCSATGILVARRAHDAIFDLTGNWTIQFGAEQLDSALSDSACTLTPARSHQARIDLDGNRFIATLDVGMQISGDIDRAIHIFNDKQLLTQPHLSVSRFLMLNGNQGSGTTHWSRLQGALACSGSNTITLTRAGVTVDPNGLLSIAPINLTVGQSRQVALAQVTGTPVIMVEPESGIVALETLGGVTTARCDAAGSATLTVTDAKGAASASVNCVTPSSESPADQALNPWLFLPGVTLVNGENWRGNEANSQDQRSIGWSRAGVATPFLNRGTVSSLVGEQGLLYTLDDTGLIFHGEKSFDSGLGQSRRRAYHGFVNPPSLESGAAGISSEHLAASNLKSPPTVLPGRITLGTPVTTLRLEQELDANDQPLANRWNVVEQTIEVTGPMNLLAAEAPDSLASDARFAAWRDAIMDPDLLGRLTSVIRLRVSESRYEPGQFLATPSSGELYLAHGVGIVFERWNDFDGQSHAVLMGIDRGNGLNAVTGSGLQARQFRIEGPSGVTLADPFVQVRVEHGESADHAHETIAWYNETPSGNQALLTLFELATDDPTDSTRVVRLSHGARGYETQVAAEVDLGMLASPAPLPLNADQAGHGVTFFVKDAAGAVIGQAGVRVSPVWDGQCAGNLGISREVDSLGATAFTLANGPHCVDVWPRQSGAFAGGAFDATIPAGVINIVLSSNAPQGIPFMITDAITQVVLVVSPDDLPRYHHISGRVTDGLLALPYAEILAYPSSGGIPFLFQADGAGVFEFDLPTGSYRFAFRHVNGESVTFGYLTAIDPTVPLSSTMGNAQYIHASALLGEVKLTAAFRITTATLSGTITDETSGHLIEPVVVSARSTTSGVYQRVIATSSGAFAMRLPVNQEYLVRVEGKGAGMLYRGHVDAFGNLVASQASQAGLNLSGDRLINGAIIDAMGIPTFPVGGRVTDATSGQGVAGVTVRAIHAQRIETTFETVTDAQGNYTLAVEAGSYRVAFFKEGFIAGLAHGGGNDVALGGDATATVYQLGGSGPVALTLPVAMTAKSAGGGDPTPTVTIRGDVTNTHGLGLAHLRVELLPVWEQNSTPVAMASAQTDSAGHYEVAIQPGFYRVYFRPVYLDQQTGKVVTVPGVIGAGGFADGLGQVTGQEGDARLFEFTGDEQVNAMLPGGVRVAGQVTHVSGVGLKGVKVEFQPDSSQTSAIRVETITDNDGRYEAFVMPNASWRLYFNTAYWDEQSQKPIKVAAVGGYATGAEDDGVGGTLAEAKVYSFAEESLLNVRLKSGVRIQGMVTAADGSGVADVLVRFQPEWDADANTMGGWGERSTDFSGHYEFDALPGNYRIEFLTRYWNGDTQQTVTVGEGRLIGGFADGQGGVTSDWSGARLFKVVSSLEVNARLGAGITLSGHVANAEGKPAIGAMVYVHLRDWSQVFHVLVDSQGDFSMIVSPGQAYQVEVWPAQCAPENTDPAQGCGEAFLPFSGGQWVTQPDAGWVSEWNSSDPNSRPVVVASGAAQVEPIPGVVMEQNDPHIVTTLRMDGPLKIDLLVEQAVEVHGRVVDDQNHGVANAWVSSDFGDGPTDGDGYFILHLPASATVSQTKSSFTIGIWPGGYEDPETHVWKSGDFVGGKVRCDPDATCRLTMDERQVTAFGSDLVHGVPWPASDLGNDHAGLVVRINRGVTVEGSVVQDGQGVGNVWVHARSLDQGGGAGASTNSQGSFAIRLPTPGDGVEVWYEVKAWSDGYLPPEPVLARVKGQGVVAVHAIDPSRSVGADGTYRPVPGEMLLSDDQGGVPVRFNLTTGNTISGRVTDAEN